MKIEKGKLYYDTTSSSFFKADEDGDNHNGFARNKIAVHCLNEQDYNYVSSVYKYKWHKDYNGRWDLVLFNGVDCISLCVNQRGSRESYIKRGYHIITIEEFKKFYPENFIKVNEKAKETINHAFIDLNKKVKDNINPSHYTSKGVQPIDYIEANGLNFNEGCIIKYLTRYKEKNGLEDLKKAKYYLERLIEGYGVKKQKL